MNIWFFILIYICGACIIKISRLKEKCKILHFEKQQLLMALASLDQGLAEYLEGKNEK